jgi:hypothetical protein
VSIQGSLKMKITFALPCAYTVAGLCLVFLFGGAGHGWGGEAFFYIGLPVSLVAEHMKENVVWALILGSIQWAVVGYLIDRWVKRRAT